MAECQLASGDLLALYTDGITEANDEEGREFGEDLLVEKLRLHRDRPCEELITALTDDVRRFSPHEQADDITLIVAKCI